MHVYERYKKRQRIGNRKEKICYCRTSKIVEKIFFGKKKPLGSLLFTKVSYCSVIKKTPKLLRHGQFKGFLVCKTGHETKVRHYLASQLVTHL